ncbi:MAG: anti-sigma regulatory factor [Chloroflexia bacterium]|nr:anti-sigma regulatory factor [Chloroflexia bacterium]
MTDERTLLIRSDLDIVSARVEARDMAKAIGFGTIDQARIATAISELTRNIVLYAGEGRVILRAAERGVKQGIEVVCEDNGPGIEDVNLVMQDGYSTSRGLGMGLPGAKRLMDEFDIDSRLGEGTRITVRKWLR